MPIKLGCSSINTYKDFAKQERSEVEYELLEMVPSMSFWTIVKKDYKYSKAWQTEHL